MAIVYILTIEIRSFTNRDNTALETRKPAENQFLSVRALAL